MKRRDRLMQRLQEQQNWMQRCGGTLSGYIRYYGDPGVPPVDPATGQHKVLDLSKHDPQQVQEAVEYAKLAPVPGRPGCYFATHLGDGGTAIYGADKARLDSILDELAWSRRYERTHNIGSDAVSDVG